jgi:hypothetical protein
VGAGLRGLASPWIQLGLLLGAFVAATLVAKAAGAEWGPASAFGQMAFAVVLVALLLRAP